MAVQKLTGNTTPLVDVESDNTHRLVVTLASGTTVTTVGGGSSDINLAYVGGSSFVIGQRANGSSISVVLSSNHPTLQMYGNVDHAGSDLGSPIKIGFRATLPDSPPSAVSENQRANGISDLNGRQIVYLGTKLDPSNDTIAIAAASTVTGASTFMHFAVSNSSLAVKQSAARVYGVHVENPNAAKSYLQMYNAATSANVGTTCAIKILYLPANGGYDAVYTVPISFGTGLMIGATTLASGGLGPTNSLLVNIDYI